MRVTTWAEYSLLISVHLARRWGSAEAPIPARAIAVDEGLPADYVEQILLRLRRARLVQSVRGAKGGYRLAAPPSQISVRDVMTAAERQVMELNCEVHPVDEVRCAPTSNCSIRPVWIALQRRIDDLLSSVTLADLLMSEAEVRSHLAEPAVA